MGIINYFKSFIPHRIKDEKHYGKFLGSFNFIRLLSWNMLHPNRFINRFRWNTLFSNKSLKVKKYKEDLSHTAKDNDQLSDKLDFLINNGGLLVNEYFNNKKIENFLNEYRNLIDSEKESFDKDNTISSKNKNNIYSYQIISLYLSQALIDIWLDEKIIKFLEHYLGRKIYAREYPRLVFTKYFLEDDLTSKDMFNGKYKNTNAQVPYFWHIDHSAGLISFYILLENIDLNSTHMQYLPGSNKYLNTRDLYSDETVSSFKNKPVDCIGKKGTIYFHSGNTLHRVVGRKNSSRLGLIFSFSPGTNIEMNCEKISTAFSKKFKIENLSKKRREILKGIYPITGGNDLIGNNLVKPKFNEQI